MEHLTIINVALGFAGIVIAFLLRLQAAMNKAKRAPFQWSRWISENWIDLILGMIGTFLGIFFVDELTGFLGISLGDGIGENAHSLLCGLSGQLIISKLKSVILPK